MSAFIVEEKTLNTIVNHIDYDTRFSNTSICYGTLGRIAQKYGYNLNITEHKERLIKEMAWLNRAAVNDRYDEKSVEDYITYHEGFPPTDIQAYKSLGCFLYQCCEGDIPEKPLFKMLEDIKHALAEGLVSRMKEYDLAVWG